MLAVESLNYKSKHNRGVQDLLLAWTKPVNEYFLEDESRRNTLEIVNGIAFDLANILCLTSFVLWSSTYRLVLAFTGFYIVLSICQFVFTVQRPDGYNLVYPGVFSLYVPYGQTNSLFYSAQVGICMIYLLETWTNGLKYLSVYVLIVLFSQVF